MASFTVNEPAPGVWAAVAAGLRMPLASAIPIHHTRKLTGRSRIHILLVPRPHHLTWRAGARARASTRRRGGRLSQHVERGFEPGRKLLGRTRAPVVQEDDHRPI